MRRIRTRRSLVLFGLAVVMFAAIFPAVASGLDDVVLTPLWLIAPAVSMTIVRRTATRCDDQPLALLSVALLRAPPAAPAVA
jgi:hypothetical protein